MADAATISVLLSAKDEASAKLKTVGDNMGRLGQNFQRHGKAIGLGLVAAGAGIEVLAKKQQELTESTRKLAHQTGMTEKEIRGMATSLSNATFPLESALSLMELASQQGLEGAEALKKYANFWDMVGDATGGSAEKMATMGAALAAVGIEVGQETELLGAFGLISQNTTTSVEQFIKGVSLLAPEMAAMGMSVDDAAVILTTMEREMGLVGRTARTELKEALEQTETGMAGVLEQLGLTETQLATYRVKLDDSSDAMSELADIHMSTKTRMDKLKSSMEDLIYAHGGLIEKAASLAPLLLAVGPAVAGITMSMRILEPVIFRIRLAMIGLNLSMGVIALVILGIAAAITAGILIWKNWDTVVEKTKEILKAAWQTILRITETVANNVIDILNDLTYIWRKQVEMMASVLLKLLDIGSKLPGVGDKFKDAADAIRGLTEKLNDGIPQIDITAEKHKELEGVVDDMAGAWNDSAGLVVKSNDQIAKSTNDLVGTVQTSTNEMAHAWGAVEDAVMEVAVKQKVALDEQATEQSRFDALVKLSTESRSSLFKQEQEDFMTRMRHQGKVYDGMLDDASVYYDMVAQKAKESADKVIAETHRATADAPHIGKGMRATAQAAYAGADVLPVGSSFDSSGWNKFSEEQRVNARMDWSGMSDQQLRGLQQSTSQEAVKWAASQERFKRNTATSSFRPGNMLTSESSTWGTFEAAKLAQGGIVTRPTLGLVGEAGPEAVIPLGRGGGMGTTNNFHFHGAVYGVEDLKEAVVEAVRDHAISGGFSGVFAEA